MSIIDFQRSIPEAGRIRIGVQVPTPNGRTRPEKIDTFRLTSADRKRIEEAAVLFGGEVKPWQAPAGPQWEVITATAALDVIVPPQAMAFSQYYEIWSAGGCQRRCDGQTEQIGQRPCVCDPEDRECDIHTRLSVMIRDLLGLGLWRVDTQGWYAARELAGSVEVLALAAGRGMLLPARLLLEQRSVKRPGANGKPQTFRFAVPRLDPGITPGQLLLSTGGGPEPTPAAALTEGAEPIRRLTPVPQIEGPRPSIAEQSAPPAAPPARRNAAPEIPSSGRRRAAGPKAAGEEGYWRARTFAEAAERGLDHDQVREIAAASVGEQVETFSMSTLDEAQWEQVFKLLPGFSTRADQSAAEDEDDEADFVEVDETGQSEPVELPEVVRGKARVRMLELASTLEGKPTPEQAARLKSVLAGLDLATKQRGVAAIWPEGEPRMDTAAKAAALIEIADSIGDEQFRDAWVALAAS